jgi:hypothetical protein
LSIDAIGYMAIISPSDDPDKIIYGRVYFFDDTNKTLILKVMDTEAYLKKKSEFMIGMGMYNSANIIERGFDFTAPALSEDEIMNGYQLGEIDKSKIEYKEADKAYKIMLKD